METFAHTKCSLPHITIIKIVKFILYYPNSGHFAGIANSRVSTVLYFAFNYISLYLYYISLYIVNTLVNYIVTPYPVPLHDYNVFYYRKPFQRPEEIGLFFSVNKVK